MWISVEPAEQLLDFQKKLIAAVAPYKVIPAIVPHLFPPKMVNRLFDPRSISSATMSKNTVEQISIHTLRSG